MKAIVYTTNTGSTKKYAEMMSNTLSLPLYNAESAKRELPKNSEVIYLGWIMAGKVKGYKSVIKKFNVICVCAVGMGKTGTQIKEIREKNYISGNIPLFTLRGNFDVNKLRGVYKSMMNIMLKTAGKALLNKEDRTGEEDDMLDMMINGKDKVSFGNLKDFIDWYNKL